ncbi:unnamed protein product [Prorocentrum cordatum]|uniref:J domain-containing protein n=1 Tax=Prorocentrum cordatum TaxID=2364126 RepID=A0ABN9RUA6_9DINO|nr:unnamed protein product [Polarella glacialis]
MPAVVAVEAPEEAWWNAPAGALRPSRLRRPPGGGTPNLQGRREACLAAHAAAVRAAAAAAGGRPVWLAGVSFGARCAAELLAGGAPGGLPRGVRGLIAFGYPLVAVGDQREPDPKRRKQDRGATLLRLPATAQVLLVSSERDPFLGGDGGAELKRLAKRTRAKCVLHLLSGRDHNPGSTWYGRVMRGEVDRTGQGEGVWNRAGQCPAASGLLPMTAVPLCARWAVQFVSVVRDEGPPYWLIYRSSKKDKKRDRKEKDAEKKKMLMAKIADNWKRREKDEAEWHGWICPCGTKNLTMRARCYSCMQVKPLTAMARGLGSAVADIERSRGLRQEEKKEAQPSPSRSRSGSSSERRSRSGKPRRSRSRSSRRRRSASSSVQEVGDRAPEARPEVLRAKREAMDQLKDINDMSDPQEKAKAFRKLLRAWHPDKNPERVEVAKEVFQFLQKAGKL